ncbi:hypothetical protein M9H77_13651 [Catharanthus roseus]|uniref:Uncharacterized protein n=1 Tax=Catharanthus roseus TaxID=4058 RepID=A0ACC0BL16_CATRO|nr:hypothetical protein M9H77_13651 [Catharanthus roseus]
MYEVSQTVDISMKVDALSKKFDQLLALNTLPANSPNVQSVCAICSSPSHAISGCPTKTQIIDSHTPSIAKLETQIWQLVIAMSRRDEGKLPSHPIQNPRANSYHEQVKSS